MCFALSWNWTLQYLHDGIPNHTFIYQAKLTNRNYYGETRGPACITSTTFRTRMQQNIIFLQDKMYMKKKIILFITKIFYLEILIISWEENMIPWSSTFSTIYILYIFIYIFFKHIFIYKNNFYNLYKFFLYIFMHYNIYIYVYFIYYKRPVQRTLRFRC